MNPDQNEQKKQQLTPEEHKQMSEMMQRLNEAFEQVQKELSLEVDAKIKRIRELPQDQQDVEMKKYADELRSKALEKIHEVSTHESKTEGGKTSEQKSDQQKIKEESQKNLRKLVIAAKKGVEVTESKQAQKIIEKLADQRLSDSQLTNIFGNLDEYLTGKKDILFAKEGENPTGFEKAVKNLQDKDPEAADNLVRVLKSQAAQFGKTEGEIGDKFDQIVKENASEQPRSNLEGLEENLRDLFPNLSDKQRKFIVNFTSNSDYFLHTIAEEINSIKSDSKKVEHFKEDIRNLYEKHYKKTLSENELIDKVNQKIRMTASEEIANQLNDIYIEIYKRVYMESAHKQFEEIEREDFMRGIEVVRSHIIRSFQKLSADLKELEKTKDFVKLYVPGEQDYFVQEMTIDGKVRNIPRMKPVAILKEVNLSEFAQHLYSEFNHWRERTAYTHNTNLTYGHPAHEGSFYKALGNYAEGIKGVDFDSFMLLPDAPLIMEAFQLYEKMMDEEYAHIDWRLRANMFSNQLSDFNTQMERDIIDYLKIKYKGDISESRILNAIKNAVGLSKGIFLTEPERTAFADPVDPKGTGFFASYGTNDSSSINALNPLHVIMRWQGEANYNQAFFMPITGNAGKFFGGWDHGNMYKNIQAYKDHFKNLKVGVEGTTDSLFIDQILGITKAGGFFKRDSWRNFYALEGHYVYKDGNKIDLVKSFKAMDAIGYEAINFFLKNINDTFFYYNQAPDIAEKEALFKFIYDRYFFPLNNLDYQTYKGNLRKTAIEQLKKDKTKAGSDVDIEKTMGELFVKRAIARVIASRFPTKFLKMDKDRFHKDNISRWKKMYELMKQEYKDMDANEFHKYMKDLGFVEMLLRSENSNLIYEAVQMSRERKDFSLGDYNDLMSFLSKEKVAELLKNTDFAKERSPEELKRVLALYEKIRGEFLTDKFLDGEAMDAMAKFPFTFGAEDTDMRLIAFRGTGPRAFARSIKDTALLEEEVINGLLSLPKMLHKMSIDGKHDFAPVTEYLLKAKDAFNMVHGVDDVYYEFAYKIAGMAVNYFKKDSAAKPLFGLFRLGKLNSIAAEYAGRSSAVWEWDSRDIDRFGVALESLGIIPKLTYNKSVGPRYEDRYINILGKRVKFGKKQTIDHKWNSKRWRKEFGGDWKSMAFDALNTFLPLVAIYLLWEYIKKSYEESQGKKK